MEIRMDIKIVKNEKSEYLKHFITPSNRTHHHYGISMKWELNEFPLNNKLLLFFLPMKRKFEQERNFQSERILFRLSEDKR